MAMSFARPDPSSPASVADAGFGTARRGFDQDEVRDFLRMVAAELGRLQERERFLERELRTNQTNPDLDSVQFDDQTLTRLLGEETTRVLTTARESAAEIRTKAEQSAAQLLGEASDEAGRLREEAEVESSRRRADAGADAEAELAMAKQQGREMVNEARAYRERVLSELARRRELAREQIEQLLHGRDRLMRSFEQARIVAVDVVAELQPLGEPDEYVNLSPTTGPLPVMVPNTPRPGSSAPAPAEDSGTDTEAADDGSADAETTDNDNVVEIGDRSPASRQNADIHAASVEDDAQDAIDADAQDGADSESASTESADIESIGTESIGEVSMPEADDVAEVSDEEVEDLWSEDSKETSFNDGAADQAAADELADADADVDADVEAEPDSADEPRDDVVVDLFARLRADADTDDETDDEIEAEVVLGVAEITEITEIEESGESADVEEVDGSDPTPFERRDADITPLIVASAKKLKRVLADEQNEALDALRRSEPVTDVDALLPSAPEHVARYSDAIAADLLAAANAGAASVATGRAAKLSKSDGLKSTDSAAQVLGEWLVNPLRERLSRCVSEGDGDNAEITRRVRAVYRECKTQHIDEQLDDVVRSAHGRGLLAALEPGTAVVWASDVEHSVCADCDDNTLAGSVAVGEEFPTGHVFAPAHIGCRCLLVPATS